MKIKLKNLSLTFYQVSRLTTSASTVIIGALDEPLTWLILKILSSIMCKWDLSPTGHTFNAGQRFFDQNTEKALNPGMGTRESHVVTEHRPRGDRGHCFMTNKFSLNNLFIFEDFI